MKNLGKIYNYNGSSGLIVDSSGNKFILSKDNIMYDNPQNGDAVIFNVEKFETVEVKENIATFVKKIDKEE